MDQLGVDAHSCEFTPHQANRIHPSSINLSLCIYPQSASMNSKRPRMNTPFFMALPTDFDRSTSEVHGTKTCLARALCPFELDARAIRPRTTDSAAVQYTFLWLPCIRFRVLFTLISKFFASFAHATYLLSVSRCVFSFRCPLPPILCSSPNEHDS